MPENDNTAKAASKTIRQEMMVWLQKGPANARDLSRVLKIQEKLVYHHLPHIEKTARAQKQKLIIHPASCSDCGYRFSERRKVTKPGRCPECRQSHILPPMYEIV